MHNHYHLVLETRNANLVAGMEGKLGEHHSGELRLETAETKAGRIVAEELQRLGWKQSDLAARRKSDPAKLAIAARLRKETTLSINGREKRGGEGEVKKRRVKKRGHIYTFLQCESA